MFVKFLIAGLTMAMALMALRQIKQHNDRAKQKVRTARQRTDERVVTLREDPETGVFRPVDRD